MQALLSTAMAGLLLLHAAAGVAWHHASGCAEARLSDSSARCACCEAGLEGDAHHSAPCQCHWECHACCNYLPATKIHVDRVADVAFTPAAACSLAAVDFSLSDNFSGFSFAPDAAAPPVRLHLLNQSLLV